MSYIDYKNHDVFVDYVLSFYSNRSDSVYPELDFKESEVRKALKTLLSSDKYPTFEGDSFDREHIRDIVLEDRRLG